MGTYSMPDFWLGMLLLSLFAVGLGWFPVGGYEDPVADQSGVALFLDQAHHMILPLITLTVAYLGEYAIVMRSSLVDTMREDYLDPRAREGVARRRWSATAMRCRTRCCRWSRCSRSTSGSCSSGAIAVETIFSWPGLGLATYEALSGPDLPMLQGLFLVFSASVIFFNLVADLLYAYLDPRVRTE